MDPPEIRSYIICGCKYIACIWAQNHKWTIILLRTKKLLVQLQSENCNFCKPFLEHSACVKFVNPMLRILEGANLWSCCILKNSQHIFQHRLWIHNGWWKICGEFFYDAARPQVCTPRETRNEIEKEWQIIIEVSSSAVWLISVWSHEVIHITPPVVFLTSQEFS
jgi:hypothetical protein